MDSPCLETSAAVIDALGGTAAVARLANKAMQTVSNWRSRGFPSDTFLLLQAALKAQGRTAPAALWRMEEPRKSEAA